MPPVPSLSLPVDLPALAFLAAVYLDGGMEVDGGQDGLQRVGKDGLFGAAAAHLLPAAEAQGVAEAVEGQHRQRDRQPRPDDEERPGPEEGAGVVDHHAPFRGRRLHPEAEERQPGFDQHCARHAQHRADDDRRQAVGQ